ncbi:MAG: hypothetical protein ABIU77_19140 [Ferruginibacter sp.]
MLIQVKSAVLINQNYQVVFDYISNYTNDVFWRAEVKKTIVDTVSICKGTTITQQTFLSKKIPVFVTTFRCTDFTKGERVVCETTTENAYWCRSVRAVQQVNGNLTKVFYQLGFDSSIVQYGLGFKLPRLIILFYTKQTMRRYLRILKNRMESNH